MRKLVSTFLVATALASSLVTTVASAAAATTPSDPSGNWKWTATVAGKSAEVTAILTLKDGKLTGVIAGARGKGGKTEIQDATFSAEDGTISFNVERERNGKKIVTSYEGKLEGDTITGTIKLVGPKGKSTDTEWKAKRAP